MVLICQHSHTVDTVVLTQGTCYDDDVDDNDDEMMSVLSSCAMRKLVAAEFSGAVSAVPTPYFSVKLFCELNEHCRETFLLFVSNLEVKFLQLSGFSE